MQVSTTRATTRKADPRDAALVLLLVAKAATLTPAVKAAQKASKVAAAKVPAKKASKVAAAKVVAVAKAAAVDEDPPTEKMPAYGGKPKKVAESKLKSFSVLAHRHSTFCG
jgi:hypothetical protein